MRCCARFCLIARGQRHEIIQSAFVDHQEIRGEEDKGFIRSPRLDKDLAELISWRINSVVMDLVWFTCLCLIDALHVLSRYQSDGGVLEL